MKATQYVLNYNVVETVPLLNSDGVALSISCFA